MVEVNNNSLLNKAINALYKSHVGRVFGNIIIAVLD